MDQCKITCITNGKDMVADILRKTDKVLEVSPVGTTMKIVLKKNTPADMWYIGNVGALEFKARIANA
jgi:hypothetical protein